jgi:hypothetical protein
MGDGLSYYGVGLTDLLADKPLGSRQMNQEQLNQARRYMEAGQRDKARAIAQAALDENPDDILAWRIMARAAETKDECQSALYRILALKPDDEWAQNALAHLVSEPAEPVPESAPKELPKRRQLPIALIGGAAVVVVLVCVVGGCLIVSRMQSATQDALPAAGSATQDTEVPSEMPSAVAPTVTPLLTWTPTDTAQPPTPAPPTVTPLPSATPLPTVTPLPPPTPKVGRVGERVEAGGIALTVVSVSTLNEIDEFWLPDAGNIFLVIDVIVENASRDDEAPYNPLYFSVKDSDSFEYNTSMLAPDPALSSGTLVRGDKSRGNVAFEVPITASGFIVTYEPLVILGGYGPIRIDLGR